MRINLCGIPYDVRFVEDGFNLDSQYGEIKFLEGVIRINSNITKELQTQTIWHEAVHGILEFIGRGDLSEDEGFVNNMALALNQLADLKIEI